jgi:drug/metabolite transporter (DMT)-like permease
VSLLSTMTPSARPSRTSFILAFAAIYIIWGSTYLGIRVAVETLPPFLMAGTRFAIAGVLLFGFLKMRGASWPTAVQWRDQALIGVFLLLGGNAVVSWAELRTPSGITALILGASPVIVVIFDWVRPGGKRPTLGLVCGVTVGIVGVAMLVGPGAIPAGERPPVGDIVALLLASVSWWIGSFYSKHSPTKTPLLVASSMQMLTGSASMLLTGLLLGEGRDFHLASVSSISWVAFAYLVVVGSIVAFPVYVWLLEHSTPAKVSTYAYVNPVVAVILGWALLGEALNLRIALAGAVIIGAVAIITIGRTREPAKS